MFDKLNRSSKAAAGPPSKAIVTAFVFLVAAVANGHSFAQNQSPPSDTPPWCQGGRCGNPEIVRPIDLSLCSPGAGGVVWCPSTDPLTTTAPLTINVFTPEEFQALKNTKHHPSQTEVDEARKALVDNKSK
jgi:hypothetical protein